MIVLLLLLLPFAAVHSLHGVGVGGSFATLHAGSFVRVKVTGPTCDALAYGAKGDGVTDDTAALQRAIAACSGSGGGEVIITAGRVFKSFGLAVPAVSNFAFRIEGTLRFINDTARWTPANGPCLSFAGGTGVAIVSVGGRGVVDGGGHAWWPTPKAFRPGLLKTSGVSNLLIKGVTWVDSPNHSLELYSAGPQEVVNTTILAPASTGVAVPSHNTDGIDVHGSPAWIHDSFISVGDDHIAIHASDTLVSDCVFGTGHGTSIGSLGGAVALSNITVRDSTYHGATTAIRIKSDTGATGYLRDVEFTRLALSGVAQTLQVCAYYDVSSACNYPGKTPGNGSSQRFSMSNITVSDVTAKDAGIAGQLTCAQGAPCGVTIRNVVHTGGAPKPWTCAFAEVSDAAGNVPALPPCSRAGVSS